MKKGLLIFVSTMILALYAYAGWEHSQGKTYWVDRPTPSTLWTRGANNGTLWAVRKAIIYPDTIRNYNEATGMNNPTNMPYSFGYWIVDTAGIIWPDPNVQLADVAADSTVPIFWSDVEWQIDTNTFMWPKD